MMTKQPLFEYYPYKNEKSDRFGFWLFLSFLLCSLYVDFFYQSFHFKILNISVPVLLISILFFHSIFYIKTAVCGSIPIAFVKQILSEKTVISEHETDDDQSRL